MKKVVYSVTRYRRDEIEKISGLGVCSYRHEP